MDERKCLPVKARCKLCSVKLKPKNGEKKICQACYTQKVYSSFPHLAWEDMWEVHTERKQETWPTECSNCYDALTTVPRKNKKGEEVCDRCGFYELRFARPRPTVADGYFGTDVLSSPPCALCETLTTQSWIVDSGKRTVCSPCFIKNNLSLIGEKEIWGMNLSDSKKRLKLDSQLVKPNKAKDSTAPKIPSTSPEQKSEDSNPEKTDAPKSDDLKSRPIIKVDTLNPAPASSLKIPPALIEGEEDEESDSFELVDKEDEPMQEEMNQGLAGTIASWLPFF
uniref:GATA-type domain-containing protein n=1 Tax=Steinernema glaseri TaxID=37863 RepID=A0A1I8A7W5_9BILA